VRWDKGNEVGYRVTRQSLLGSGTDTRAEGVVEQKEKELKYFDE
jgi:hypothetical protein